MSDVAVDANAVYRVSGREIAGVAGAAITKGQSLAFDSSDSRYYLADNDSGTAARKTISGIALEAASAATKPLRIQKSGVVYLGVAIVVGTIYCVSSTAGGICPYADLNTGDDVIIVGVGGPGVYEITLVMKDTNTAKP